MSLPRSLLDDLLLRRAADDISLMSSEDISCSVWAARPPLTLSHSTSYAKPVPRPPPPSRDLHNCAVVPRQALSSSHGTTSSSAGGPRQGLTMGGCEALRGPLPAPPTTGDFALTARRAGTMRCSSSCTRTGSASRMRSASTPSRGGGSRPSFTSCFFSLPWSARDREEMSRARASRSSRDKGETRAAAGAGGTPAEVVAPAPAPAPAGRRARLPNAAPPAPAALSRRGRLRLLLLLLLLA